jgi:ABC-type multidrug transport system fused ATPase/permease subunit
MESNLYRYIIRHSLKLQVGLVTAIFVLTAINPVALDLKKNALKRMAKLDLAGVLWFCALFLGTVLASGALKYIKQNIEGIIEESMLRDLRSDLYHRILRFPLPHIRNTPAGQLISMMLGEVEELGTFFGQAFSVPVFNGLMLLGSVGYMVYLNPVMALLAVAFFPLQIWLIPKLQRRVSQLARDRVRMVRRVSDRIQESVGNIQEIYANETVAFESSGFRGQLQKIFHVRLKIYNLKYLVKWINNFLDKLGYTMLLTVGGWVAITRPTALDVASVVVLLDAYNQLNEPWRELIGYFQDKETARIKYEQVIVSFDPPELRPEFPLEERLPEPVPDLTGAYEVRGVSVVLDGATPALDRLQLSIPPNQQVAIVGTAGSGKSTLALVLAKLYGYTGTAVLNAVELAQMPAGVAGRRIAYLGGEARLLTGTIFENLVYGLRHRPPGAVADAGDGKDAGAILGLADEWLDLSPIGATDRAGLIAALLETARLVALEEDLFSFGLRSAIDPASKPEIADRLLKARHLVMERFKREGGEAAVEFFDRTRFAAYSSIGENILFGQSASPDLGVSRLAEHEHFRRVIAEVGLREPLLLVGVEIAKEMVEIFKDIPADHELFTTFSLITASELPEYTTLVSRLERTPPSALPPEHQDQLIALSLRLIPARHRLGTIDDAFMAKVVAARQRFAETFPPGLGTFAPYDRDQYFAQGTLLENMLFGRVLATSSLAVKKVNTIVEEVITTHGLREVVMEAGLDYQVGIAGGRLSPVQRQKVALGRALLKRPQILILDEAVDALEPDKRAMMHQRITEVMKGRAVFAVIRQPDLARYYDRVVVLDAGKVAEVGTYQELAAKDGLFRHLMAKVGATA